MKLKFKQLNLNLSLCFLACNLIVFQPILSVPIDLSSDWEAKVGRDTTNSTEAWENFPSFPLNNFIADHKLEGEILLTFRKTIALSQEDIDALNFEPVSIHIPFIGSYYEILWNQEILDIGGERKDGKIEKFKIMRHLIKPIPYKNLKVGANTIHIVLGGIVGQSIDISNAADGYPLRIDYHISNLEIVQERVSLMLMFLYGFMGLYHLLFYFKRPQEQYNLYYGIFSILLSIYIYTRSQAVFELEMDTMILKRIEFISVYFIPGLMSFFLERYFLGKVSLISRIYLSLIAVVALLTAFSPSNLLNTYLLIWQASVIYVIVSTVVTCVIAIRRKVQDVRRLLVGIIVLIICGIWDVGGATGLFKFQNYGLMRYGFFVFVVGIAFILANRFLQIHREVESLNNDLEEKVLKRTEELQHSLTEIQSLKVQQDGDYFLTSLLINPLTSNKIENTLEDFDVQFYSKQKKAFEFRERKLEIGGDINIVDRIQLKGKEFIAFVNGDAMGKSMQGAGGALVLGVIFHSVVTRTNSKRDSMNKGPETWLKECYIELQNVFETFDGSMLISVIMGLIDVKSGCMFYFNAEHPWSVLYRDERASFIETSLEIRKIGTMGIPTDFRIRCFLLEPGDVIFLGSDGRDDLLIGRNAQGERIINEDETQFLHCVEEGRAELEPTVQSILTKGELTDDLSLIRIAYNPDSTFIDDYRSQLNDKITYLTQTAKTALKDKNYQEASLNFSLAVEESPMNTENYYYASYAYKFNRNYQEALNYGERLYLREPNHLNNLLNLADVHRFLGNTTRANFLLNKIDLIDPENELALKIKSKIDEASLKT